jgi:Bax protein
MHNIFIFPFFLFFLTSITSTAFEDNKINKDLNITYELNVDLDDLVLNYCISYDSYTVNRLYSQKKTLREQDKIKKSINKILASIKKKPQNSSLSKLLIEKINFKKSNNSDDEINLDYLSVVKKEFVKTLLPLISYENQKILLERASLKKMKKFLENNHTLSKSEIRFLEKTAQKYRLKTKNKHKSDILNELLNMVDIIPNSIVLAQAANESGWGGSRFAKEYNALFGEYTYDFTNGVVPLLREEGERHLVKAFDSIDRSVQSYFNNLNSHYAYKEFRNVRKIMRERNNFTNINLLVNELGTYAADENYIQTINSIIKVNKLDQLDNFNYFETKS